MEHEQSGNLRALLRVENGEARHWYMNEAVACAWSGRQLDRQISTMYFERLLSSREKQPMENEAKELLGPLAVEEFIKDPYVLDFLALKDYPALRESDLEQVLIDKLQEFLLELGRGFCFVARQKLMRYEDEDFYLDLYIYHMWDYQTPIFHHIEGAAKAVELELTEDEIAYLEEPYVPHALAGVMAQNKPCIGVR